MKCQMWHKHGDFQSMPKLISRLQYFRVQWLHHKWNRTVCHLLLPASWRWLVELGLTGHPSSHICRHLSKILTWCCSIIVMLSHGVHIRTPAMPNPSASFSWLKGAAPKQWKGLCKCFLLNVCFRPWVALYITRIPPYTSMPESGINAGESNSLVSCYLCRCGW